MMKLVNISLIVCLLCGSFIGGAYLESKIRPVEYITLEIPVIMEKVVEVERIVEKPIIVEEVVEVEREIIKKIPLEPRPFLSLEELQCWVNDYETNVIIWSGTPFENIDCDDFALSMMIQALYDGYLVTTERVNGGTHMVVAVPIGGVMYYVEATPYSLYNFKEVWCGYSLD